MLFLQFRLGEDRYAMDTRHVAEVLPLVQISPMPRLPAAVAGVFNYHGSPVPAIDLSQMLLQRPAVRRFNTRIVLVHYPDESGVLHLLGLIAERVSETAHRDPSQFTAGGVNGDDARHLGPVALDASGFLQWIEPRQLLPPALQELLFRPAPVLS
jgi:chemotaxis-related protein WspB